MNTSFGFRVTNEITEDGGRLGASGPLAGRA